MNLTLETLLHGVAATLRDRIRPEVPEGFAAEMSRLATLLVSVAANAVDDAAAVRVWENQEMRQLFADAVSLVDGDLSSRLAEAAASVDPGLRISELDGANGRLRTVLIALQAEIEVDRRAAAQDLNARIWGLLRTVEERRAPRM
ncbi:hypothetical protein Q4F19_08875 [Sphingomonas sp. BIUV-7]|uniref:Uncharacterized protein n=1 Tax=Sphingomonas natans TaxID=3063330 RepID=A0ABT8Y841_9SPHN|nr:hypothetical protein [Sphingomonas sp. BIUV-7]MDO6414491.1 hypothetical protein [Sphingomonas sp. BIUV-7]